MSNEPRKTKAATPSAERLKSLVDRIEKLKEEAKAINIDIRDVFSEAKGIGYDVRALRKIILLRGRDSVDVAEEEAMLDVYKHALGMADSGVDALADRRAAALLEEVDLVLKLTNTVDPPSIKAIMNALECSMGKASKLRKLAVERIDLAISFHAGKNSRADESENNPSLKSEKPGNGRPMTEKEREAYFAAEAVRLLTPEQRAAADRLMADHGVSIEVPAAATGSLMDRVATQLEILLPGKVTRGVKVAVPVETQSEKLARVRGGKPIAGANTPNAGEATNHPPQDASSPPMPEGSSEQADRSAANVSPAVDVQPAAQSEGEAESSSDTLPAHDPARGEIIEKLPDGTAIIAGKPFLPPDSIAAKLLGDSQAPASVAAALGADPLEPDNSDIFDEPDPIAIHEPSQADREERNGRLVNGVDPAEIREASKIIGSVPFVPAKPLSDEEKAANAQGLSDARERAMAKFKADQAAAAAAKPDDLTVPAFLRRAPKGFTG